MPEMTFTVRWPDGTAQQCYSPSLVVHEHLDAGTSYTVEDFVQRSAAALQEASDRVRAKYGFACTSAAASLAGIESVAGRFSAESVVVVEELTP